MKKHLLPDTSGRLDRLFEGFNFASRCDAWMAATVTGWIHLANQFNPAQDEPFRPPLVVISGPPGSGKTSLASRMAELACDVEKLLFAFPDLAAESDIGKTFEQAAALNYPALVFDNVGRDIPVHALVHMLTAEAVSYRPIGRPHRVEKKQRVVAMMALSDPRLAHGWLNEHAVHIRLTAREESASVKGVFPRLRRVKSYGDLSIPPYGKASTKAKPARKAAKKKGGRKVV